ncbi:hypothetical protein [Actinoalloteichus sp. GBA129-24]|nr:hypothetical protein [Actinoalloteichus sp. GBA129-24]APU20885.1 hypothetical protein UA75_14375 [Actinoalloteichus sp. GBA129-24]
MTPSVDAEARSSRDRRDVTKALAALALGGFGIGVTEFAIIELRC